MADNPSKTRSPSAILLLMGLAALGISAWSLLGPGTFSWLTSFDVLWILVAAAGAIGLVLILVPGRRRSHS